MPGNPLEIQESPFLEPPQIVLPTNGLARLAAIAYLCISAAVVEEIFFRGLFRHFMIGSDPHPSTSRVISYVLVSSISFGLCHWERGAAIVLTMSVFGIAASILYLRSASVYPLVGAHAVVGVLVRAF
jgi:membrane protease YdiL (CAAX protease family)